MNDLRIETEYEVFYPGNQAVVTAVWSLDKEPESLELRLVWNTSGKGDQDLKVVQIHRIDVPAAQGRKDLTLTLPWGPYSFSGKLISLIWALELVVFPDGDSARKEIVIGPNAQEVVLNVARP